MHAKLLQEGASFSEMADGGVNSVELVAKLINRGENIVDGIVRMQKAIEGSVCLLLMTTEGIYAARDRYGRFPLVIGREIYGLMAPRRAMLRRPNRVLFPIWVMSRSVPLGPARSSASTARESAKSIRLARKNMSALFCGSIRDTRRRFMKGSALKMPGRGADRPWPEAMMSRRTS